MGKFGNESYFIGYYGMIVHFHRFENIIVVIQENAIFLRIFAEVLRHKVPVRQQLIFQ